MTRSFSAQDWIKLPVLTAEETVALATELVTVASEKKTLPESVVESVEELRETSGELAAELRKRVQRGAVDSREAKDADVAIDRAWSAVERWLSGWMAVEEHPRHNDVAALYQRLFSNGLTFVTKSFKEEWTESSTRLAAIDEHQHDETFELLGGKIFLSRLRAAHDRYGDVLGITKTKEAPLTAPLVRATRDATLEAMREHVARITATVHRKKPESAALAEELLRPLTTWPTRKRATAAVPQEAAKIACDGAAPAPESPTA